MPKVIIVRNFYAINDEEWRVLTAVNHLHQSIMRLMRHVDRNMHEESRICAIRPSPLLCQYSTCGKELCQNPPKQSCPTPTHRLWKWIISCLSSIIHRLSTGNGYRLTNLGYDFLALHKFIKSNIVYDLSNFQLFATGKESDLYFCKPNQSCREEYGIDNNCPIVLKFHRLGRTSFKQVKNKREYKSGNNCSWLYMNRISATREYLTMKVGRWCFYNWFMTAVVDVCGTICTCGNDRRSNGFGYYPILIFPIIDSIFHLIRMHTGMGKMFGILVNFTAVLVKLGFTPFNFFKYH